MKKITIIICLILLTISLIGCASNNSTTTDSKTQTKSASSDNSYLKKIHEQYFIGSKKLFALYLEESNKIEAKKLSESASIVLEKKIINEKILPGINNNEGAIHQELMKNIEAQKKLESVKGNDKDKRKLESEMLILGYLDAYIKGQKAYYETIIRGYDNNNVPNEVIDTCIFGMIVGEYNYNKSYYKLVENKDYEVLTKKRFGKLNKGDSIEVVSIQLAMPGKLEGTELKGDRLVQTYVWHENSGANIKVKFIDNRMYSAEQSGLK